MRLARAEKGSLIILVPDPEQATWLNLERPIFANRALRVILFSTAETSSVLARRAPDFFSWISHRIECPPGPVLPAVRGIQAALRTRARGLAWMGGDLEGAFSAALPGRALVRASAAMPYEQMVEAAKPAGKSWIVWSEVDGPFRLRRVRWAMAEAGRRGRSVLLEPAIEAPGFLRVDGRLAAIKAAREQLEEAGAKHAGRLAALMDLDPVLIRVAGSLLNAGGAEENIEAAAHAAADPGRAVEQLAAAHAMGGGTTVDAKMSRDHHPLETLLLRRQTDDRRWVRAARGALAADDAAVATIWSKRALALVGDEPETLLVAGRALDRNGAYSDAASLLQKAVDLNEKAGKSGHHYAASLVSLARVLMKQERNLDAERLFRRAVAAEKQPVGRTNPGYATALHGLATALRKRGRYTEAERLLKESMLITRKVSGKQSTTYAVMATDLGSLLTLGGKYGVAENLLRDSLKTLRDTLGEESAGFARVLHALGHNLLERGKPDEAEELLRRAIAIKEKTIGKTHRSYAASLHELARSLIGQGSYDEADELLSRARIIYETSGRARTGSYAASLSMIAAIRAMQGDHAEAERLAREAVSIEEEIGSSAPQVLCATLSLLGGILAADGRTEEAEELLERSVKIATTVLGRDHPHTARSLHHLATFQAEMESPQALTTARLALSAFTRALGSGDSGTQAAAALVEEIQSSSVDSHV